MGEAFPFLTPVPGSPSCTVGPPASQDHLGVGAEGHPAQGEPFLSIEIPGASLGGHRTSTERGPPPTERALYTPPRPKTPAGSNRGQRVGDRLSSCFGVSEQARKSSSCTEDWGVLTRPPHISGPPAPLLGVLSADPGPGLSTQKCMRCGLWSKGVPDAASGRLHWQERFQWISRSEGLREARGCRGRGRTRGSDQAARPPSPSACSQPAPRRHALVRCAPGWLVPTATSAFPVAPAACLLSRVQLFVSSWTLALQPSTSIASSWQACWSELLFPSPGIFPPLGVNPRPPPLRHCGETSLPLSPRGLWLTLLFQYDCIWKFFVVFTW